MSLAENTMLVGGEKDVVEEFVALSSLDEKVERFSAGIVGNIENDRNSMPVGVFDKYKKIIISFFDPLVLKENVRVVISERYDEEKMGQMIDFMKHPKIVFMAQKEESSKSSQAMQ